MQGFVSSSDYICFCLTDIQSFLKGFQGDKPSNTLWQSSCRPRRVVSDVILHHCDAYSGSSGSAVLVKSRRAGASPTFKVTAVHVGSKYFKIGRKRIVYNVACQFTRAKVKQLQKWTKNWLSRQARQRGQALLVQVSLFSCVYLCRSNLR